MALDGAGRKNERDKSAVRALFSKQVAHPGNHSPLARSDVDRVSRILNVPRRESSEPEYQRL